MRSRTSEKFEILGNYYSSGINIYRERRSILKPGEFVRSRATSKLEKNVFTCYNPEPKSVPKIKT